MNIYLVFCCDGWGHNVLAHCASTELKAWEWCYSVGDVKPSTSIERPKTELDGWPCVPAGGSRYYEVREVLVDGVYVRK